MGQVTERTKTALQMVEEAYADALRMNPYLRSRRKEPAEGMRDQACWLDLKTEGNVVVSGTLTWCDDRFRYFEVHRAGEIVQRLQWKI